MSLMSVVLWWVIASSLGLAAIVALEPLWTERRVECPVRTSRAVPRCDTPRSGADCP